MDGVMSRKCGILSLSPAECYINASWCACVYVCMCVCACVYVYVSVCEWVAHMRRIVQSVGATLPLLSCLHNATKSYGKKMYTKTSQNTTH